MTTLEKRLEILERKSSFCVAMPIPVLIIKGEPTPAQQAQIDEAEAKQQQVIIVRVVDAGIAVTRAAVSSH
jgi:hypothetical protein